MRRAKLRRIFWFHRSASYSPCELTFDTMNRFHLSSIEQCHHRCKNLLWRCLSTQTDPIYVLPWQFLRAADAANFDPLTHQRLDVKYDLATGKPLISDPPSESFRVKNVSVIGENKYKVKWSDDLTSTYPMDWVQEQANKFYRLKKDNRVYWTNLTEKQVRDSPDLAISFQELITENGMRKALRSVFCYGILLVKNTPIRDGSGVAAIGAALGGGSVKDNKSTSILANYREGGFETVLEHGTDGPLRTLYGSVWSTSSSNQEDGTSKADSSYGSGSLPLHTDMTYIRDPPGLQIFTMVQPALNGGESIFGDGFAVANELRMTDPGAFAMLSQTTRRFRCVDNATGWNLQACGPVISVYNGKINSIRHNDLDRLPDLPPVGKSKPDEIDEFYESLETSHAAWDKLLAQDKFRLIMKLQPGDTMVVANQVSFTSVDDPGHPIRF